MHTFIYLGSVLLDNNLGNAYMHHGSAKSLTPLRRVKTWWKSDSSFTAILGLKASCSGSENDKAITLIYLRFLLSF